MAFTAKRTKDGKVINYQMISGPTRFKADDETATDANTMKGNTAHSAKMDLPKDFAWNNDDIVETDTESIATLVDTSKKVAPNARSATGKTLRKILEEKYLDATDFGHAATESDTESMLTLVASPKKPYTKPSAAASRASSANKARDEETDFEWNVEKCDQKNSDSVSTINTSLKKGNTFMKSLDVCSEAESCFETDFESDAETLVKDNKYSDTESILTLVSSSKKPYTKPSATASRASSVNKALDECDETISDSVSTMNASAKKGNTFMKTLDICSEAESCFETDFEWDTETLVQDNIYSDTESILTLAASSKKTYTKPYSAASRASSVNKALGEETDFEWNVEKCDQKNSDSVSTIKASSKKANTFMKKLDVCSEAESCFESDFEWDTETLVKNNKYTEYDKTDTDSSAVTLVKSSRKILRGKTLVKTLDAIGFDKEDKDVYSFLDYSNKKTHIAATDTSCNKDSECKYFDNDFESSLSAFENMSLPKEPKDMSAETAKSHRPKRDAVAHTAISKAAKEASYQGWLDRKKQQQQLKLEAQKKQQKCREEAEALRKQQAQERFNAWCKEKELQKKKEFEKFTAPGKGNNLTGRVPTITKTQQTLKDWERAKDAKQQLQREKLRKEKERKQREEAARKQMSQKAWQTWEKNSKNRPKPVPLNQGMDSLRGTVSGIYINPNEWVSNLDADESRTN